MYPEKGIALIVGFTLLMMVGANATVLTGVIDDLPESVGLFTWGDGTNDLYQQWSVQYADSTGYFYGSTYAWSNADVYTYSGLTDPTTISDASVFPYSSTVVVAKEGDVVFFRGTNGYYGAWRIDDIFPSGSSTIPVAYLDGQWYFQDNGSANFTSPTAVEPSTWAGIKALYR